MDMRAIARGAMDSPCVDTGASKPLMRELNTALTRA